MMMCNFNGQHLRVAVTPQPPLVNCFQNYFGEWMCNGSNIEVINILEQRLNFQADWLVLSNNHLDKSLPLILDTKSDLINGSIHSSSEHLAGFHQSETTNSNHSGILNLVANGRAWLSANGIIRTPERERNLIISEPFDSFKLHFLLSKYIRDHDHLFIKPFNSNAWLAIFVAALSVIPVFYFINTTSSHYLLVGDEFLEQISIIQCLRYTLRSAKQSNFIKSIKNPASIFHRNESTSSSSSSSSSESDDEIYKISESIGVLELERSKRRMIKFKARKRKQFLLHRKRQVKQVLRDNKHRFGFFKLAYIIWYVVGSLAAQGGETEDLPHASSTRILIAFWWLYLIVISSIHSGILTAILTFPKQNDFIQTLDDFLDLNKGNEKMKLTVDKHSELAYLLSDRENLHKSRMQDLFNEKPEKQTTIVEVDFDRYRQRVLDDVLRGNSAYLEEKSTINMIISQEYFDHKPPKCLFKSSRFTVDSIPMSLVLSPNFSSKCILKINTLLSFIMRTGLARKWRRKYEVSGNDCLETVIINAGDVDKIEFRHVKLGFWLLSAGLLCGFIFLIAEVICLFTADDGDEDSDISETSLDFNSSESESSSDSTEFGLRFGHRVSRVAQRSLKSLKIPKFRMKPHKLSNKNRCLPAIPSLTLSEPLAIDSTPSLGDFIDEKWQQQQSTPKNRSRVSAEKRSRRFKRTIHIVKRLQEGKIYSDFFLRVSYKVQTRARRASRAITNKLTTEIQQTAPNKNRFELQKRKRFVDSPFDHSPIRRRNRLAVAS